ncbi:MAG TPA: DUF4231 domain-containing protein [Thermoanaerobaculia bacterium]|jgi:hypothetical protein
MTPDEYMTSRVDDQIAWYERKSAWNQRGFKRMRVLEIFAAAAIPILSGYSQNRLTIQITIALLGGLIAIIAGLMGLFQFQENWTQYRSTCEGLRHEKILYETKSEPYDGEQPFPLFVQRVESLISSETGRWTQSRSGKKEEKG